MPTFRKRITARARELRNAATPAERVLWQHLSGSQLGVKFSRQMPVLEFYADFLCREYQLVVELDGLSHDLRREYDAFRDRRLLEAGYRVLHFSNEDVLCNAEGVVIVIRSELQRLAHP